MAQVKFFESADAAGIRLSDKIKMKGKNLELEFEWEFQATADCDPAAKCLDKFRVYFGQAAAGAWNKASTDVQKKMVARFDDIDKRMGKFIEEAKKKNAKTAEKDVEDEKARYQKLVQAELDGHITKDIGADFMTDAQEKARQRILKEGTKIRASKLKIIAKVVKVLIVLTVAALAVVATVMTGGAAAPLLVAVGTWAALATSTSKRFADTGKTLVSLRNDLNSHTAQMEKKLAELNVMFQEVVKYANDLEAEADAIELKTEGLKATVADGQKALAAVNDKSGHKVVAQAQTLIKQLTELRGELNKSEASRPFAAPLREAYAQFRKVQFDPKWGTKMEKLKERITVLDSAAKGFESAVKLLD